MWTQSTKCAHKVSQFTFHLLGVHTQLISHTLRNSDAARPINWDVNRDKCKLCEVKGKKKENVALFRAEILLRYWFYWVSRKVLLCFSNFIVKLIFGYKLKHCILYFIIVPLYYNDFHVMCSRVINFLSACVISIINFLLQVIFKFH